MTQSQMSQSPVALRDTRPPAALTANVVSMPSSFTSYRIRYSLIRWLVDERCTHALTLNVNRDITFPKLSKMFGEFCLEVDRLRNAKKRVAVLPASDRVFAVAFPEHMTTNPHLHLAMRLDGWWRGPVDAGAEKKLWRAWRRITSGAGSMRLDVMDDPFGWGQYVTKDFAATGGQYLLSHDYHHGR